MINSFRDYWVALKRAVFCVCTRSDNNLLSSKIASSSGNRIGSASSEREGKLFRVHTTVDKTSVWFLLLLLLLLFFLVSLLLLKSILLSPFVFVFLNFLSEEFFYEVFCHLQHSNILDLFRLWYQTLSDAMQIDVSFVQLG